ncbi:MAG: hypothetical protein K9J13_11900 [Saprospiraceae bacterium]|nr:hypothetical protein [Saprospiraceae bacterium]
MLAAAVVIMLNFNSCGKYEDGPKFSLKSKTARLVGEWEVVKTENAYINFDTIKIEVDKLDNLILEFEENGDCNVSFDYTTVIAGFPFTYSGSDNGEWAWGSKKESIEVEFDKIGNLDVEVMRLTSDELWFEDDEKSLWECEKVK